MSDHNNHEGPLETLWTNLCIPPHEYDVVVSDIDENKLKSIGKMEEIENLSPGSFSSPAFPVNGRIYGVHNRLMICLACQRVKKPIAPIVNVWFLVDTGSPYSYLTEKTISKLTGSDAVNDYVRVAIQDQSRVIECHKSHGGFVEANLLGMNALQKLELTIERMSWKKNTFCLVKE